MLIVWPTYLSLARALHVAPPNLLRLAAKQSHVQGDGAPLLPRHVRYPVYSHRIPICLGSYLETSHGHRLVQCPLSHSGLASLNAPRAPGPLRHLPSGPSGSHVDVFLTGYQAGSLATFRRPGRYIEMGPVVLPVCVGQAQWPRTRSQQAVGIAAANAASHFRHVDSPVFGSSSAHPVTPYHDRRCQSRPGWSLPPKTRRRVANLSLPPGFCLLVGAGPSSIHSWLVSVWAGLAMLAL